MALIPFMPSPPGNTNHSQDGSTNWPNFLFSNFSLDYSSFTPTDHLLLSASNNDTEYSSLFGGNFSSFDTFGEYQLVFPRWLILVWTVLLSTVMALGLLGNILVPVVVLRTRDLRTSTNFLLVNLAVADILVLAVCLPTALTELHTRPGIWILGEFLCEYQVGQVVQKRSISTKMLL